MTCKKASKIICVITVFLLIINYHFILHLINNGDDVVFSTPNTFHFRIVTSYDRGDVFEEYDADYNEAENIYYYKIPKKYLNNDDVRVYVSGYVWNCLAKPYIKVNGIPQSNISFTNKGGDYCWSNRMYHFNYNNTIQSNVEYTFYTRFHNYSQSSTIVFLPE